MLVELEKQTIDELNGLMCAQCCAVLSDFLRLGAPSDRVKVCDDCELILSEMMRRYKQTTRH
jgi:hypothetical protein